MTTCERLKRMRRLVKWSATPLAACSFSGVPLFVFSFCFCVCLFVLWACASGTTASFFCSFCCRAAARAGLRRQGGVQVGSRTLPSRVVSLSTDVKGALHASTHAYALSWKFTVLLHGVEVFFRQPLNRIAEPVDVEVRACAQAGVS